MSKEKLIIALTILILAVIISAVLSWYIGFTGTIISMFIAGISQYIAMSAIDAIERRIS